MATHIAISQDLLAAFCARWRVTEVALFGSVLRDDFGPDSDVDVLVRFEPDARHTLLDLAEMENELTRTLGRKADLVARDAVEGSPNYIRRGAILRSAQTIYNRVTTPTCSTCCWPPARPAPSCRRWPQWTFAGTVWRNSLY